MPGCEDKDLIKNVNVTKDHIDRILINSVLQELKKRDFDVTGKIVSYYSPIEEMYIFIGKDPISRDKDGISIENLSKNRLCLKFRQGQNNAPLLPVPEPVKSNINFSFDYKDDILNQDDKEIDIESFTKTKIRTKERNISFIVKKISMWRKIYNKNKDNQDNIVRYSLEDAAKQVGISRKSLDDYLLQLKYGKKYGFDFTEHKDAKVGILRAFVNKNKRRSLH
jgi:hypothetical protein